MGLAIETQKILKDNNIEVKGSFYAVPKLFDEQSDEYKNKIFEKG